MPIAITEEQHALREAIRRWASRAGTIAAVRAREAGPRPPGDEWHALAGLGIFALGLPGSVGGTGTITDLAVALEQVTDALVPGPVTSTVLAGLLLAPHADTPAVKEVLPALTSGAASVAVGWGSGPVLDAGTTSHLLLPHAGRWLLLDAHDPALSVRPLAPLDFSRSLAQVTLSPAATADRTVMLDPELVRDTAALLACVQACAVAAWSVRTAAEYAEVRTQFGRAIGSFQAVKHLCATMLCRSERAASVTWDATVAHGQSPAEFGLAVAAAASIALDAAVENAKDCVQVLGGTGFTWEHDAHLYLRRAVSLRQRHGDGSVWRQRVATLALGGARRSLRVAGEPAPLAESVRAAVRHVANLPEDSRRAALADTGLLTPDWPRPYGLGATPAQQLALDGELHAAGIVRPDIAIAAWALPTIIRHGTDEQRERFVGPSLRGEVVWCQLFSEPEAGSDLAGLRTRAQRVDGGWLLTGQKVWTSLAHRADWAICLARTDPGVPKHQGITYFLVRMDSPGLQLRPLREITGDAVFNEVFLDDVFVPDRFVVGAPGDGWRLARGTLENERVAIGRGSSLGEGVERILASVVASGATGDALVRDRVGGLVADGLAMSTMELRATLRRLAGSPEGAESAVRKLVGVAQRQAVAETALLLLGPEGTAVSADVSHQFLLSRCLSIAGGTTQILLSLVGERVLGLPREP